MRTRDLLFLAALFAIGMWSCEKDEEKDETVKNLQITHEVTDNKVSFTANAENANTYDWDFGNGETASGAAVEVEYKIADTYEVKCTANGKTNNISQTQEVTVLVGDPEVYNDVAKLLCGFDEETGESNASWKWAVGFGMMSSGEKSFSYDHDSATYAYFDPINDSWWKMGEYGGVIWDEAQDDVYTFTLNKSFDYSNEYGETGFMWNWVWAEYNFGADVEIWGDIPLMEGEKTGSWELEVIEHESDTLPKTIVSGKEVAKSYVITLKGGAYLGIGASTPIYQICRIDADTCWVRYDNTIPSEYMPVTEKKPTWAEEGVSGDPEWGYFYLVKN